MNEDNILFQEQQEDFTENKAYRKKAPWKLGKHLKNDDVEKLNKVITDHHKRMFHLLNNKEVYTEQD
jgi:hypothetical protein